MRRAWVVTWIVILSVIISSPLFSNTVVAITGNFQPDNSSYVGVIVLFSDTDRQNPIGYCSGFLISPRVMVTAGHSLIGTEAVSVCFDDGPISYAIKDGTSHLLWRRNNLHRHTRKVFRIYSRLFRQPRICYQRHRSNNTGPNSYRHNRVCNTAPPSRLHRNSTS